MSIHFLTTMLLMRNLGWAQRWPARDKHWPSLDVTLSSALQGPYIAIRLRQCILHTLCASLWTIFDHNTVLVFHQLSLASIQPGMPYYRRGYPQSSGPLTGRSVYCTLTSVDLHLAPMQVDQHSCQGWVYPVQNRFIHGMWVKPVNKGFSQVIPMF